MNSVNPANIVSDINVTPMVDVMLVLLIIFMVVTPLFHGGAVDLVRTLHPVAMNDANKEDAIIVSVTRSGQAFLSPGNRRVALDEVPAKVSDLLVGRFDKTVYVRADARSRYHAVQDVVDALRAAGVDQLGLITEQAVTRSL